MPRPRTLMSLLALVALTGPTAAGGASASAASGAGTSLTGTSAPEIDRRLFESNERGSQLFYDDRFHEAIRAFKESVRIDPKSPTGHVFLASTYQTMMAEYRTRKFLRPMRRHLDKGIELAERRIDAGEELGRSYQFLGAAYGNLGLYHMLQDNWFRAFRAGHNLADAMVNALRLRPDIADSDYGYGFFLYWRTIKASIFRWLAGGDQRAAGIKRLERTVREGELCSALARQSLMQVYLEEKRYDDLHRHAAFLRRTYPRGITAYWWEGKAYVEQKKWSAARRSHEEVLSRLKSKTYHSTEAVVEARYFIALADAKTGAKASAKDHLKWIVAQEKRVDDDLWLGPDYIDLAEDLLEEL